MRGEERKRRFNYSYLLQQKESERGRERHWQKDGQKRARERLTHMGRYSMCSGALWELKLCRPGAVGARELHHKLPEELREEHRAKEGERERDS